jgi:hypothetical protein
MSSSVYKPKFVLSKYPTAVPEDAFPDECVPDNVTFEQYVPESKKPVPVELHTRANYFGTTTAEPLKPAVVYQDKETQTEPVVFTAVPAHQEQAWYKHEAYKPCVRSDAAELLSENIGLQREVDALRLEMEKLSIELNVSRSAEERRLAEDKMRLEQLERAAEDKMRQTLQQKAREPAKPAKPAQPAKHVKPVQPVKAAQAPVHTRTRMPAY